MTTAQVIEAVAEDLYEEELVVAWGTDPGPPAPGLTVLDDPFLSVSLEGRLAARAGADHASNPYPPGSWWHFLWGGAMMDETLRRKRLKA